jgi:hypothetical protein
MSIHEQTDELWLMFLCPGDEFFIAIIAATLTNHIIAA